MGGRRKKGVGDADDAGALEMLALDADDAAELTLELALAGAVVGRTVGTGVALGCGDGVMSDGFVVR